MIELKNISKSYLEGGKRQNILAGVNARFLSGHLTVILGKSGSGKSTLLNLIGGIDTPDSGHVLFNDKDISLLSDFERTLFRRRHLGFVFQFFNLIPTLTVLENTLLITELDGALSSKQKETAREILSNVGLGTRLDTMPDNLSGGEQQRVAVARALAHDPEIILADEPTGNLDNETGKEVLNLMIGLIRENDKTLIMATHSEDALSKADVAYRIEKGVLIPVSTGISTDIN